MRLPVLHFIDPALGRLDYDSLSDQALMEMLFESMETDEKANFQDENGNYLDIDEWYGVECEDDRVVGIDIQGSAFHSDQFRFSLIPAPVRSLNMMCCALHGTLDTADLPAALIDFDVSLNKLHGTLDFHNFPRNLERIRIQSNNFSGSCKLADLPRSLLDFNAGENGFCGEISLHDLPPAIKYFDLQSNALTGSLCINKLPESIEVINLCSNSFSGDFRMLVFPLGLEKVDITKNKMSGTAIFQGTEGAMHFILRADAIESVVDENGDTHKWHSSLVHSKRKSVQRTNA